MASLESRIIITGAAGFIGSNLLRYFYEKGATAIGIDNLSSGYLDNIRWIDTCDKERLAFHTMNICDKDIVTILQSNDIIIHCAGLAPLPANQENPGHSITNNVAGTANLLEAARVKGVKHVILASTSAIYENNTTFPSYETDKVQPTLIYSMGKKFCEELCQSFNDIYGLPYTVLRFFNVYGPHHDCLRKNPPFIAYLIKELLEKRQPLLHSNGNQRRDYIYIDDLLELIHRIILNLSKANKHIYNVASGESVSVNEIVEIVRTHMNRQQIDPIFRNPVLLWEKNTTLFSGAMPIHEEIVEKEVCKYSQGANQLAITDFDWKPTIGIKEGLIRTIDYTVTCLTNSSV